MNQVFLRKNELLIQTLFDFFTSQVNDPEYFKLIIEKSNAESLQSLGDNFQDLQNGFFTSMTFSQYASLNQLITGDNGVPVALVEQILSIFADLSIIDRIPPYSPYNTRPKYHATNGIASWYKQTGCLFNRMFGFDYISSKYGSSVFKISILKNHDYNIGTGFLIKSNGKSFLLTNKHVVDGAEKIKVLNSDDVEQEVSAPVTDELNDLAIIQFKQPLAVEHFKLHKEINILSEVLTIGYPPVARSKFSNALFHKGEVNSFIEDYSGSKLFLFSAKTNPGNSGSPIIDHYGTVIGIASDQLEHKDGIFNGKLPYYAGIPSSEILVFLEKLRASGN